MKKRLLKSTISVILSAVLVFGSISAYSAESEDKNKSDSEIRTSPVAEFFDDSNINPQYKEWVENGGQGIVPSMQDFSYLSESYEKYFSRQNYSALKLLPETYDLRDTGKVSPVHNQEMLSICWSVSANSVAESSLLGQFPHTSFSSLHTSWFTFKGDQEEEYFYTSDPYAQSGSNGFAVGTMAAWKGPVFEEKAPFDGVNPVDMDEALRYTADYHLQDAYYMPTGIYGTTDRGIPLEITKEVILNQGSVAILYNANTDNYNPETYAWYNNEEENTNHVVTIVGWDDNYPKENFCEGKQPENDGAWLVRNSWGTEWGDEGYFWLSYEDKTTVSGNTYILEEADNYSNNYQYDITGWSYSIPLNSENPKSAKAANIFTAENDEQLEAVSFYTTDVGTSYSISIYTGVDEGQPQSGTLKLENQTGTELYSGYHTIELDHPVKLNKGERFSIVIDFENPTYTAPVAIEMCIMPTPDYVPKYLGSGGESYGFVNGKWLDVCGVIEDDAYITNVCIKGFTNPLPDSDSAVSTVRFSEMEGPVPDGTEISLTANGTKEIYYSFDNSSFEKYTAPITIDFTSGESVTLYAYGVDNEGSRGNTVQKQYTKASSELTDLAVKYDGKTEYCETENFTEKNIYLPKDENTVQFMAQGTDKIFLDGVEVNSSDWNEKVFASPGKTTVKIVSKADGKNTTEYVFNIYKSEMSFDYENETIIYDQDAYTVKDENGNTLNSGSSVSHLIKDNEASFLTVTPAGGEEFIDFIPSRFEIEPLRIHYSSGSIYKTFDDNYMSGTNPDMSDAVQITSQPIFLLTPGVDLYIQRNATDKEFKSQIYHLEVPAQPEAPKASVEKISSTSVTLQNVEGAMYAYSSDNQQWQSSPVFTDLTPGTTYRFGVIMPATYHSFVSEVCVLEVTTKNPSDYNPGDVNMDGEINVVDVSLIQRFLVNLVASSDEFDKSLADYNQDGKISIIDATYTQIYIASH